MPKFRKKPGVVEAEQWFPQPEDTDELPMAGVHSQQRMMGGFDYYVVTIHEQKVYLEPGDWIIAESDGVHFYPCKPDIFAATYEAVEEGE